MRLRQLLFCHFQRVSSLFIVEYTAKTLCKQSFRIVRDSCDRARRREKKEEREGGKERISKGKEMQRR